MQQFDAVPYQLHHGSYSPVVQLAVGSRVLDLLKRAEHVIDKDPIATRHYVSSALALLDTTRDKNQSIRRGRTRHEGADGGLARWQERRIVQFVMENIGSSIGIKALATLVRLSPSYFCKSFKITFGVTPHTYLMDRRVEQAQSAMVSTTAAMSEIALDYGFSDQAHFCRVFREKVGEAPGRWRHRQQVVV